MSNFGSWTGSIVHQLEHTPIFEFINNIANVVVSKVYMWLNVAELNMSKRSSWNDRETIQSSLKGVKSELLTSHNHIMVA